VKLVVGLGNPGRSYDGTRHNVGFDTLSIVARRCSSGAGTAGSEPGAVRSPSSGRSAGKSGAASPRAEARSDASGNRRPRFQGETSMVTIRGCPALLLWPLTWMNLSGGSVLAARDFYKIQESDILVVCDDFNLPFDAVRLRKSGSAGGQKGLADILARLGTQSVPRLRVGIGPVPKGRDPADWVLARFSPAERVAIDALLERAADAVEDWVALGIDAAMNRHN